MFLHQFSLDEQINICKNMLKLLKNEKGSMIIGAQSASTLSGEEEISTPFLKEGVVKKVWRHSKESFREMWESIAETEGENLRVWVEYRARYELGRWMRLRRGRRDMRSLTGRRRGCRGGCSF
jgi:head-tail adaptor